MADQNVTLRAAAWFGDAPLELSFPAAWDVAVLGARNMPALEAEQIAQALARPVGSPPLRELARGRRRAAILIDDLTRPTPVAALLPALLDELNAAGMDDRSIVIVVAGGTHAPASSAEIRRKVGDRVVTRIPVIAHDAHGSLRDLGRTPAGLPLAINAVVAECDLKIGVGCIYPHPAAGFSGGAKIVMPGICGAETTRMMHDYLRGAARRGGALESELRREIEAVAARVGLDFIVNVVLTPERQVGGLFAGDRVQAHRAGVQFFAEHFYVAAPERADIVIADMYPFDTSLQFAYDRGLWPVLNQGAGVSRVVVAACPQGLGSHALYPIDKPLLARLARRLRHLRPADLRAPLDKLRTIVQLTAQKRSALLMLAPGVGLAELQTVFPRSQHFAAWPELRQALEQRHSTGRVRVALYRCAPLHMPAQAEPEAALDSPLRKVAMR